MNDLSSGPGEWPIRIGSPGIPGYWRNEISGVLQPVVEKYLRHESLTADEVRIMRAYLRQWVAADFCGIAELRRSVELIDDEEKLRAWMDDALDLAIDPL